MVQAILILVVFLFFAFLMFKQKIPSFLALLLMSVIIPLIAGTPLNGKDGLLQIINAGSFGLASSIPALVFGAWVGEIMSETGISKDIVRRASELAGDRALTVAVVMYLIVSVLFTSLTGLGAHIMIAMLVLPIFSAVGIKPLAAACIMILANTTGSLFNMSLWTVYLGITKLTVDQIKPFAVIAFLCSLVAGLLYIFYELKIKKAAAWAMPVETPQIETETKVPLISLLTPLIPFPLVIGLHWDIIPALIVGAFFGAITASYKRLFQVLSKTLHEAIKTTAPALVLFIMIGIVLKAVQNSHVSETLLPFITPVLPHSGITFALFFILLVPLALYRGPLQLWGMGAGVAGLMISAQTMTPMAICAAFLAIQLVQHSCDPTNTYNVWTADYEGLEVNSLTVSMLPVMWLGTAVAIVIASFMYF